ncbi:NADPH-dependent 7-cyano-7-deazaguanine reductase QueF [Crenobacter cavernae]|uniref:NADPH-dependent 7-cyano-7-deazaguanine reductase n=1 Tax=Crenobacter cavernae TaxID=2290923 RepID=A0A345Y2Z9_9NEIS|nr:NADPH-dependent 7-cyano-7-deazaguanine reductase QueF [Crenobacter cavernae]AXK38301.1 NADPH-dependent 7-cyano-7-deazaguanine reductase QueF [Crenobacter cavernae]
MTRPTTPELSPLGKTVSYQDTYDASLLFPIARHGKREEIGVDEAALPFSGVDVWTGYELSWLNPKGKPQVAIVTFLIPATSANLVESKSFKLYLNSFNQTKLDSAEALEELLEKDLSAATGAPVTARIALPSEFSAQRMQELEGESIDELDIEVDAYTPDPSRLKADPANVVTETLRSELLKSNCLVTGQPDWGGVQIAYTGPKIDRESLLRYLIGFRRHNEFHEQCVERIFMDISRECGATELTVFARYTRRGGLDINPFRTNSGAAVPDNVRTARQ